MLNDIHKAIIIDHRSTISMSDQIYKQMEVLLSSAKVVDDQPISSINSLAQSLHINLDIIKKVYERLVSNKFIYIDESNIPRASKYGRIIDFFNKHIPREDTKNDSSEVIDVKDFGAKIIGSEDASFIQLKTFKDHRFLKQCRLFKSNERPYVYIELYYPIERFPKLLDHFESAKMIDYESYLSSEYGIQSKKCQRLMKVQIIESHIASLLDVNEGVSHFVCEMTYFDQGNHPYCYALAYALPYFSFEYNIKIK